jgi:hypothetical protein
MQQNQIFGTQPNHSIRGTILGSNEQDKKYFAGTGTFVPDES